MATSHPSNTALDGAGQAVIAERDERATWEAATADAAIAAVMGTALPKYCRPSA